MPQDKPASLKSFVQGLRYAFQGLRILVKERNMQFHIIAAILVLLAAWVLDISFIEWSLILFCIGLVMCAEGLNTSIEFLCDYIQPNQDPKIGIIKDLAAASVFIAAIVSAVIGLVIFLPKII